MPMERNILQSKLAIRPNAATQQIYMCRLWKKCLTYNALPYTRTGYERHVKAYKSPVQSSAGILRGAPGADGVDMEGKVVVITG
jgi:hypothetical protein